MTDAVTDAGQSFEPDDAGDPLRYHVRVGRTVAWAGLVVASLISRPAQCCCDLVRASALRSNSSASTPSMGARAMPMLTPICTAWSPTM